MKNRPLTICILAAGKGNRMKSTTPKVLHEINRKPMIHHVLNTAKKLQPEKIIIVVGFKKELGINSTKDFGVSFATQNEQKGTAHAVQQCNIELNNFKGNLLVLSGDVPLITQNTLMTLIETHNTENSKGSILSTYFNNPFGYGRIVRDENNNFKKIVEHKDANEQELNITEINSGTYIFDCETLFKKINLIKNNNSQSEYYLTDIFDYLQNEDISVVLTKKNQEIYGINTIEQLNELEK